MARRKRFRDAVRGRFVTPAENEAHPDTTVAEQIDFVTALGALRRIRILEVTMLDAAATLAGPEYDSDRAMVVAGELERVALDRLPGELDA